MPIYTAEFRTDADYAIIGISHRVLAALDSNSCDPCGDRLGDGDLAPIFGAGPGEREPFHIGMGRNPLSARNRRRPDIHRRPADRLNLTFATARL